MTSKRIVLTNKETGQVLPEAELINEPGDETYMVRFDSTVWENQFDAADWTATYPEPPVVYRNGDVLRRVDRQGTHVVYVFKGEFWWSLSADGSTERYITVPSTINQDAWELV